MPGLFKTKSGIDITQTVMELLWQASEHKHFTFEMAKEAFAGQNLTSEDIAAVWRTLGLAGVHLVSESAPKPVPSAAQQVAEGVMNLPPLGGSAQSSVLRPEVMQALAGDPDTALLKQMQDADHEMRQIVYGLGFAAHEHMARAEKLLAHPSAEHFEQLVADSRIQSRNQYLLRLPSLVKETGVLDQAVGAAYRNLRQTFGQSRDEAHQTEFARLNRELRQTLPRFGYQAGAIREMITIAQGIAGKFRASRWVLLQAGRDGAPVSQMPLVDVERQSIETMEELVRMPWEVFLRNCMQLTTAAMRFQQAKHELVRGYLHLVASIAQTCSNRGLLLPELLREGIFGLARAVEQYAYRHGWRFSTYAACWIRRSIRDALAATRSAGPNGSLPLPRPGNTHLVHPLNGSRAAFRRKTGEASAARKAVA